MLDYINSKIEEFKKTFDDKPVILVEVHSVNPDLKGKMFAITEETAGFPTIQEAIQEYNLKHDTTIALGVSFECLEEMNRIQDQQAKEYAAAIEKKKQEAADENFGCLASVFIGFILFAVFVFWCIGAVFGV